MGYVKNRECCIDCQNMCKEGYCEKQDCRNYPIDHRVSFYKSKVKEENIEETKTKESGKAQYYYRSQLLNDDCYNASGDSCSDW